MSCITGVLRFLLVDLDLEGLRSLLDLGLPAPAKTQA